MPFTVTDEALDALESASEDERLEFEKTLTDDEFKQIEAAIPTWRAKKQKPAPLAQGIKSPTPGFDLDASVAPGPESVVGSLAIPNSGAEEAKAIGQKMLGVMNPANALDKVGNFGASVAEKIYQAQDAVGNFIGLPVSPAEDVLRRSVASGIVGEKKAFAAQDPQTQLKGVNALEEKLGPTGTAATLGVSQALGNLPSMAVGFGAADKGAKIAMAGAPAGKQALSKLAGAVAGNALEGAATAGVQGAIEGDDPFTRAIAGAAFGGGVTLAGAAVGKAASKIKGVYDLFDAKGFWQKASEISPMAPEQLAMEAMGAPKLNIPSKAAKISDPGFKPSYFTVVKEGDKTVARVGDIRIGEPVKVATFDISDLQGAEKFRNYAEKHQLSGSLTGGVGTPYLKDAAPSYDLPYNAWDASERHRWALENPKEVPEAKTDLELQGPSTRVTTPPRDLTDTYIRGPNLDAPPVAELEPTAIRIVVDRDNHVTLAKPPPEVERAAIGDFGEAVGGEVKTNAGTPPRVGKEKPILGYIKDGEGSATVKKLKDDPSVPGNILVQRNGAQMSIPAADFHPAMAPAESLKLVPDAVPRPANPVDGTDFNPAKMGDLNDMDSAFKVIVRKNPSIWDKLLRAWGGNHLRGSDDLMAKMRAANGLKQVQALEADYRRVLKDVLGGKPFSQVDTDFELVARSKMAWEDFAQRHPGVADQVKATAEPMLRRRDQLHEYFKLKGLVSEPNIELKPGEELEPYLARLYMRNVDPKRYSKLVPSDVVDKAIVSLVKRFLKAGDEWTPAQIRSEIDQMIKNGMSEEAIFASRLMGSKALDRLKKRKIIPDEIRNLLGEINSGQVRVAHTIASQEALYARQKLFDEIAANPAYYSHGPQPHLHPEPIPNDRRAFGDLAGGYVSPEIHDFILMAPKIESQAHSWVRAITRFRKGNLVAWGGFNPLIRSTVGNLQGSVYSGGLDLMRPRESGQSLVEAVRAIRDFHKDPTGNTGLGKILREMRSYGADWAGIGEEEISGKSSRFINEMSEAYGKRNNIDAFTFLEKLHNATYGNYKSVTDKLGNVLDLNDKYFRVANYISLKKKYLGNPAKWLPGIAPQDIPRAAAELASKRINQSFMNAPNVGKTIKNASQGGVGFFAPFLTTASEEARILAMLPQRFQEEPDLKWRMMQFAMLGAAAFGTKVGLQKYMDIGPSEEKIDAALGNMPDRQKFYKPLVTTFNQEGDKLSVVDLTPYFMPAQLLKGHPDDSVFARALANTLLFPVEGGQDEGVRTLLESTGLIRPTAFTPQYKEGEQGLMKTINAGLQTGMLPRVGATSLDALRRTGAIGNTGIFEEKMTPLEGITRAVNLPVPKTVDALSPTGQLESAAEIKQLEKQLKEAGRVGDQVRVKAILDRIGVLGSKMGTRGQNTQNYSESKKQ